MAADEEAKIVPTGDSNHGEMAGHGSFPSVACLLRSHRASGEVVRADGGILSPGFRSAAAMAGWDEEALLAASLVVEDTPVRERRDKKRTDGGRKSPPSTNSRRKRRSWRRSTTSIPPVTLRLDEEHSDSDAIHGTEEAKGGAEAAIIPGDGKGSNEEAGGSSEKAPAAVPCLDRLREELSCAICLDICFEPSTTPCGHSFCKNCLKCAAAKCGKRCPKCRDLISGGRSCSVNTVLWNTIQLLFPAEVAARKKAAAPPPASARLDERPSRRAELERNRASSVRRAARMMEEEEEAAAVTERELLMMRRRRRRRRMMAAAAPSQSEDAALALRLQREEFMEAAAAYGEITHEVEPERRSSSSISLARANLRAMASRAIQLRGGRRS